MKYLTKTILTGIIIGTIIAVIDIGFKLLAGGHLVLDASFASNLGYYFLYAIVLTLINISFFDYLNDKVVWKNYGKYRLLIGIVGSIVLSMLGVCNPPFY